MVSGRVSRGVHVGEASRALPIKRGEKPCPRPHDTEAMRAKEPCPGCKAVV